MHVAHDVRDDSKRLPLLVYLDLEHNLETFKAYQIASEKGVVHALALTCEKGIE